MARLLVAVAIAWPVVLAAGVRAGMAGDPSWFTTVVYLSAGRVCHQRPERSFETGGVQWPVCGRCAGLYLAAPIGALAALVRRRVTRLPLTWLGVAAAPTAVTFALEFAALADVSSLVRLLAALPLGAAVAFAIVAVTRRPQPIG